MNSACRNVRRAFARLVGLGRTAAREGHLTVENDVRGIDRMRVVGVKGVGTVLPDIDVLETFLPQLPLERVGIHAIVYPRGRLDRRLPGQEDSARARQPSEGQGCARRPIRGDREGSNAWATTGCANIRLLHRQRGHHDLAPVDRSPTIGANEDDAYFVLTARQVLEGGFGDCRCVGSIERHEAASIERL
jgi:hypothetical protein